MVVRGPGDHYGCHRSLIPAGSFPQAAEKLDASLPIYENEILIAVERLNIDAASFHQLKAQARSVPEAIGRQILGIVEQRGKMHNPATHSGGMLLGTVAEVGPRAASRGFAAGDRIATLVSLTLTPLHLAAVDEVDLKREQVKVRGHAILFECGMVHRLPADLKETVALAVFDVCGAPALTAPLAHVGGTVVVLGAGKAGLLAAAAARRKVGRGGTVFVLDRDPASLKAAGAMSFLDAAEAADATDPSAVLEAVKRLTQARMADLVVNCAPVPRTETASILAARRDGTVLFFNMATGFQAAVLAAEGMGHETRLIMGNGYTPGHAELALQLIREFPDLREWFDKRFS